MAGGEKHCGGLFVRSSTSWQGGYLVAHILLVFTIQGDIRRPHLCQEATSHFVSSVRGILEREVLR
jgi:hypothetical protein